MVEAPHGEIDVHWFDNVLINAPLGPINGSGAKMFAEKIGASITFNCPTRPWARVEFFRDFYTLATPDAYRYLLDTLFLSVKYQCEVICVVGVNSCNVILFERYSKIAGLPFRAFDNLATLTDFLCVKDYSKDKAALMELLKSI